MLAGTSLALPPPEGLADLEGAVRLNGFGATTVREPLVMLREVVADTLAERKLSATDQLMAFADQLRTQAADGEASLREKLSRG